MRGTSTARRSVTSATKICLRRRVYDDLMKQRGAASVNEQLKLTQVSRSTLMRARAGRPMSYASASQLARALDVPLVALFEEIEVAA